VWLDSSKALAVAAAADDAGLAFGSGGSGIQAGDLIRVEDEVMLVRDATGQEATVVRGQEGTQAVAHPAGTDILRGKRVSLVEFFTGTKWSPQIGQFGILPLVTATLITSVIAMLVALPLGLGVAVYLSEYASERARRTLKPILEVLSGIPTVVYGYFALTFMTPLLRGIFGQDTVQIYNMASAGLVIGILILPLVSSMSEDALSAVPRSLREAAYAVGATKLEVAVKVVVPAALSGIAAAVILATSRAVGETMVVAIAAGQGPNFTFNPFRSAETMTGHMVRISGGDLSYDSIDYNSIFAIGLLLFLITLLLNLISQRIVRRFREVYD
jgi:phosphate transport system permease protein